jgi:signal transduction histidine kinase
VSTTSSRSQAPAGHAGEDTLFRVAVAGAVVLCVVYLLVPTDSVVARTALTALGDLLAIVGIVTGVRRYRPRVPAAWLLLAAGLGMWAVADLIWGIYQLNDQEPFPSWSDPFYLAGYPLFMAGLMIAAQARTPGVDVRAIIDPAIVTVGAAFAAWVFLVAPVVADDEASGWVKLVAVTYPVCDLLLLAVGLRLILDEQWRDSSLRLLLLALALVLVGDVWYALAPEEHLYALPVADTCLLAGALCFGLAALDPSMPTLTERQAELSPDRAPGRLGVAVGASLIVPLVLLVQIARGGELHLVGAVIATTLLAALVVVRYAFSASRARRAAHREETLRRYAVELLAAGDADELYRIAEKAASDLAGDASAAIVRPAAAPTGSEESFALPVEVGGKAEALIIVSRKRSRLVARQDALASFAAQLSLALERQQLLAREHEAARALNEQVERLRELDRMKDQFVSSVSHELRSPLTSIVGFLELLLQGEAGALTDDQHEFLGIIDRNCTRLTKLVDDILFVARVDAGRLSLSLESIDVAELAAASVQAAGPVAAGKEVELRLDAAPWIPPLCADATRISQLLDNLISNAIKFTPEGGVVTVVVGQNGDSAHLEVRDTGVGIPPDEVHKLFVRFFRASTSAVAAGTGLGLSIAKSIVEAHRGMITVESELGVGTAFLVDLPLHAPSQRASAPDARGATA